MISKLSNFLSEKFIQDSNDTIEDVEEYQFALFIIISNAVYLLISIIVGLILSSIIEMMLFYTIFQLLRIFAGGFHSNSEIRCEIISFLCICLTGLLMFFSKYNTLINTVLFFSTFLSGLVNYCLSPIEAEAKPLTSKERKKYRRISLIILCIIIIIINITYSYKVSIIYIPCCLSLLLESILLVAGAIKGRLVNGH